MAARPALVAVAVAVAALAACELSTPASALTFACESDGDCIAPAICRIDRKTGASVCGEVDHEPPPAAVPVPAALDAGEADAGPGAIRRVDAGDGDDAGKGDDAGAAGDADAGDDDDDAGSFGLDDAGPVVAPAPSAFPYPPARFDPAALSVRAAPLVVCGEATLNVDDGTYSDACTPFTTIDVLFVPQLGGDDLAVVALPGLQVDLYGDLWIRGSHPVALAVFGDATIDGYLYVDAEDVTGGPGARDAAWCGAMAGEAGANEGIQSGFDNDQAPSGGGGGGGANVSGGGGGGDARDGKGGVGGGAAAPAGGGPLVGGCPGGRGGGAQGGEGGAGGGALQISTAGRFSISGIIGAGGGGGKGGGYAGGGGGGGSGGFVHLEAAVLALDNAIVIANGGGGGEGGGSNNVGESGDDANLDATCAEGGAGWASFSGDGGRGAAIEGAAGGGGGYVQDVGGGGGGGGGDGVVHVRATTCEQTGASEFSAQAILDMTCP